MKRVTLLLSILAVFVSCNGERFAEGRQMFRELLTLRDQLGKEFHEKVVDVNLRNTTHMTVKFVNSPMKARSHAEKQQRADAVAVFVRKNYPRPVQSVMTQFVSQTGGGGLSAATSESYVGRFPAAEASQTQSAGAR